MSVNEIANMILEGFEVEDKFFTALKNDSLGVFAKIIFNIAKGYRDKYYGSEPYISYNDVLEMLKSEIGLSQKGYDYFIDRFGSAYAYDIFITCYNYAKDFLMALYFGD